MFSTKGQEVKQGTGTLKSLQPGVVLAHIHSVNLKESKTGKMSLEFVLEGPELENFEGWSINKDEENGPKFKGQSARVQATAYTDHFNDNDVNKNEILNKIIVLADELGLREDVDVIGKTCKTIQDYVERTTELFKGHNLHWFLKGTEEEYNGKTQIRLSLPKFKFAAIDASKLDVFDKGNVYHYKPLDKKPVDSFAAAGSDDLF